MIQPRWILKDHTDVAWCVAFAPDGKSLVSCAGNRDATAGELRGYRLDAGKPVPVYRAEEPHGIRWVAFAPDGKSLATAEYDGKIRIRDAATGTVLTEWLAHRGGVQCVKFTRDGRTLVSCGKDGTAKVWDVATRELKTTMDGQAEYLYTLDLSHDDKTLLTGASDATAALWDVETGERKGKIIGEQGIGRSGAVLPERDDVRNRRLGPGRESLGRHDRLESENPARHRRGHPRPGLHARQSSHRSVGTELGELQVWDVATGSVLSTIAAHDGSIRAIAFSPDGKLMATAGHDWTIKLWDSP